MQNFTIIQGTQLDIQVNQGDSSATSVTLIMSEQEANRSYSVTSTYADGVAIITLTSDQTSTAAVYDYQINENIEGEDPIIYGMGDCEGDCGFPTITICESLGVS